MNTVSFQKWLYSKKNMAGCILASVAVLLYLAGIIDAFWWAIVVGFYGIGYYASPPEKTTVFFHFNDESLQDYKGFIDRLYKNSYGQLPKESSERLDNIRINAHELIDFLEKDKQSLNGFNQDLFTVKKIFDQYLPNLINNYLKLPKRYAENVILGNSKTSKDMLLEQIIILDEQVKKISYAMYENDTKSLQVHGKLLEQKFENEDYFKLEKVM